MFIDLRHNKPLHRNSSELFHAFQISFVNVSHHSSTTGYATQTKPCRKFVFHVKYFIALATVCDREVEPKIRGTFTKWNHFFRFLGFALSNSSYFSRITGTPD